MKPFVIKENCFYRDGAGTIRGPFRASEDGRSMSCVVTGHEYTTAGGLYISHSMGHNRVAPSGLAYHLVEQVVFDLKRREYVGVSELPELNLYPETVSEWAITDTGSSEQNRYRIGIDGNHMITITDAYGDYVGIPLGVAMAMAARIQQINRETSATNRVVDESVGQ